MGVKPKPTIFGDDCLTCYPPGETPYELICFLSGVSTGSLWLNTMPPAPNGRHLILQSPTIPCAWHDAPTTTPAIGYFPDFPPSPQIALLVQIDGGKNVFLAWQVTQCARWFENTIVNPIGNFYYGGFAIILTPAEILAAVQLVMAVDPDTVKFEVTPGPDGIVDIRVADTKHRQNLIIQFDSAEL